MRRSFAGCAPYGSTDLDGHARGSKNSTPNRRATLLVAHSRLDLRFPHLAVVHGVDMRGRRFRCRDVIFFLLFVANNANAASWGFPHILAFLCGCNDSRTSVLWSFLEGFERADPLSSGVFAKE
jgi:hypothetical protein